MSLEWFVQSLSANWLLFLAIFIPGIVTMYNARLATCFDVLNWVTAPWEAIFWGTLNALFVYYSFILFHIEINRWFLLCLFIIPLLGPWVWAKSLHYAWYPKLFSLPFRRAFDHVLFMGRFNEKVIAIHMKNGEILYGYYLRPDSCGSTFPTEGDLYLSYEVDKTPDNTYVIKKNTAGLLIKKEDWEYLSLLDVDANYQE